MKNYELPIIRHCAAEVPHNGHIYRFEADWDAGWVLSTYFDNVLIEKRLTDEESGKAAIIKALLALKMDDEEEG